MDFTTVEVWTTGGLVTHYVAFVMELATRKVICAGITPHPDATWMQQIGRNLADVFSGFLVRKRFLIMDRDVLFHPEFRRLLEQSGIRSVRTPPSAPNCNAHLERFHGSFKREAADRVIFSAKRICSESWTNISSITTASGITKASKGRLFNPGAKLASGAGRFAAGNVSAVCSIITIAMQPDRRSNF